MRYLGIDYGTKRVGIALSDEGGSMAFPRDIFPNDVALLEKVIALIESESVDHIVIGESAKADGTKNPVQEQIAAFVEALGTKTTIPITFQKEFFTSAHARGQEGKESLSARKTKQTIDGPADAGAATLILQRALDKFGRNPAY